MNGEFSSAQWLKFRKLLAFAIFLALMDVCIIGALLYLGVLHLP